MHITYQQLREQKLRLAGYLTVTIIFFLFFMLEMAFTWHREDLYPKIFLLTVLHTLAMWEPTRLLILQLRKRFAGIALVKPRLQILIAIAVPYAGLLGFAKIYFEDRLNVRSANSGWSASSYTIGITLLFVLLQIAVYESIYFFSEWQRTTREAEEMKQAAVQVQMDSLKVQIQPHFLFNTLNTLIGLIEINQQSAVLFTQNLSYVYRYLLQANEKTLVTLEEELEFAATYFMLLKTRYADGLEMVSEVHSAGNFQLPPLTLQVLIENAVKHNIVTQSQPLHIYIYLDKRHNKLIVQNNYQPKQVNSTNGIGLRHLRRKYTLLNLPEPSIQSTTNEFCVSIPLLKMNVYERIDY